MKKITILVLLSSFFIIAGDGYAQSSYKNSYTNGQRLFDMGEYELAMEAYKPAMEKSGSNAYAPYASFYYAVSAYRSNYKPLARDMFLQILKKFPGWEFEDEINYWLAILYFEEENYPIGLQYTSELKGTELERDGDSIELKSFSRIDSMRILTDMFVEYPENKILGKVILNKMKDVPLEQKDFDLIQDIAELHNLEIRNLTVPNVSEKKDIYKVGVMFPFIYQNLEVSGIYLRQSLVVDLYEGIKQGVEAVRDKGVNIKLYAYDTRGDTAVTSQLLKQEEITQMDLIIGPLVPGPSKLVSSFSYEHQINIINPVSNNAAVTGNNPFSFLLNPSSITIGKRGGEFAVENLKNKNIIVYYGDRDRDFEMAMAFKEVVEADSFNILSMKKVYHDSTEWIFDKLTYKILVLDSLGNKVLDEEEKVVKELLIPSDSIGSIFVATFDYKIASEVFSAVAERGDSIQIIGHGRWLLDKTANYQSLQDLGIWMLSPNYVDFNSVKYKRFEDRYIEKHHAIPSKFVVSGFECMIFIGYCMDRFGKYFQNGLDHEVLTGIGLGAGYDFRFHNNNQLIPILKFENLDVVMQNALFAPRTDY